MKDLRGMFPDDWKAIEYKQMGNYGKYIPGMLASLPDSAESSAVGFYVSQAMHEAAKILDSTHGEMLISGSINPDEVLDRFGTHPDVGSIARWLTENGRPLDDLGVICYLSLGVLSEWDNAPKFTKAQHEDLYAKIQKKSAELVLALAKTKTTYEKDTPRGLHWASVAQFLNQDEWKGFAFFAKEKAETATEDDILNAFPRVSQLLERLASEAERIRVAGPAHQQPNKAGASRGYFVRRMHEAMCIRYQVVPVSILAAVTTVAMNQATDPALVAGLLKHS